MITTKTIFSNGTFQLDVRIDESYTDAGLFLSIKEAELYEYAPDSPGDSDPYILVEDPEIVPTKNDDQVVTGMYLLNHFAEKKDRLVKWVLRIDPFLHDENGATSNKVDICCADVDSEGNFVVEGYAADLSQYERGILDSINLKCNDCEVPRDLLNKLLKLFTVRAAIESKSPYIEMIFSKLMCGKRYSRVVNSFSRKCNCNG